jgi:hypothetical protein
MASLDTPLVPKLQEMQGGTKVQSGHMNHYEDIPWSPRNTWIVIGISGGLLIFILAGSIMYETLWKPNSFAYHIQLEKCVPVRSGEYKSMEACVNAN